MSLPPCSSFYREVSRLNALIRYFKPCGPAGYLQRVAIVAVLDRAVDALLSQDDEAIESVFREMYNLDPNFL